ncbi:MAG: response regulator [Elusimicrobia bacterium]|nr:response regulator [Elusimicrobiota bacterium]
MEKPEPPLHVLIVDDAPDDLALSRLALERAGLRVSGASTLREAREALDRAGFEVLLVDLRLPDGDGLDLLSAAREKDPQCVGVVLTGFASTDAAVSSLRRGAYDFLTKPCGPEALTAAVGRAGERSRLARALAQRTAQLEALNRELDGRVQDSTRQISVLNDRLKRFIVQMMESNDARVKFMDNATHELKNPLSVIWGHAVHLLGRDLREWTPEELELSLKAVRRNADALGALLDEMSDASRLSSHKLRLEREPLHAFDEARGIVESFEPQAAANGVALAVECGAGPGPAFSADKLRLRQVLANLLSNALKFTPAKGRITVAAASAGSSVRFSVADTGSGIEAEDLPRVFDRFYQVEGEHRHKGLGLGLEIAKGLVTLHGGTIWVESKPGHGAKFLFAIPCAAPDENSTETPLPKKALGR